MTGVSRERKPDWVTRVTIAGAVLCIFTGLAVAIPAYRQVNKEGGFNVGNLSAFGSYLQGATASFFSLGGLLLIVATFRAQQRQIAQQEQDQKEQSTQFREQQESVNRQNFESSFFQLLNLRSQTVAQLRLKIIRAGRVDEFAGNGCFEPYFDELRDDYGAIKQGSHPSVDGATFEKLKHAPEIDVVKVAYNAFYEIWQQELSHNFRNLYHIIKFVHEAGVLKTYGDKRRYTSLVRAQLSAFELLLLFYDGLSTYGEKFKPLIEEYGLLEHLERRLLMNQSHAAFYADSAYK